MTEEVEGIVTHSKKQIKKALMKIHKCSILKVRLKHCITACLEVELKNNTDYPTVPGPDLNVEFRLNEQGLFVTSYDPVGLNLTADTYEYGYNPTACTLHKNIGTILFMGLTDIRWTTRTEEYGMERYLRSFDLSRC